MNDAIRIENLQKKYNDFTLEQNRMITEYLYGSWADDLIDGQIAAEDADGIWVRIDPITGEVTGTLPEDHK